jgi:hypothetical protein
MLGSRIVAHPFQSQQVHPYASRITDTGLGVQQSLDRARDWKASRPSLCDRY